MIRCIRLACALLLITLLGYAGCGDSPRLTGTAEAPALSTGDAVNTTPLQLPAPGELLGSRQASAATLARDGADFNPALPNRGVTANGTKGSFAPTNTAVSPPEFSYAIYEFNVDGVFAGPLTLAADFGFSTAHLGVANFTKNFWEFGGIQSGQSLKPEHIAPDGTVYIVVLTYNNQLGYVLQRLSFAAYDEVEDNDTPETANTLPGANFSGFRGNCGKYEGEEGYDGDGDDWFTLTDTFVADQPLNLWVNFQPGQFFPEGEVHIDVYSNADVLLKEGSDGTFSASANMVYGTDFTDSDLPLKIHIHCNPNDEFEGGDYFLGCRSGFAPTAVLVVPKFVDDVPATVILDASGSTDPDGNIVEYEWDHDGPTDTDEIEGIITTEPQLEVEWPVRGAYTVNLTVRDATGYVSFAEEVVLIGPNPFDEIEPNDEAQPLDPLKADGWLGNVGRDSTVEVKYDGSDTDTFSLEVPPGESARFTVELTDGDGVQLERLAYNDPGLQQGFTLYWDSALQLRNGSASPQLFRITVGEGFSDWDGGDYTLRWFTGVAPTDVEIVPSVTSGAAPLTVDFTANATDDGTIAEYQWSFDEDGMDATGSAPSYTFTEAGTYSVRLIVFDDDGLRASDTQTITVN